VYEKRRNKWADEEENRDWKDGGFAPEESFESRNSGIGGTGASNPEEPNEMEAWVRAL
jgi:hypothetical protein